MPQALPVKKTAKVRLYTLRLRLLVVALGILVLLGSTILYNGYRIIHQATVDNGRAAVKQTSQILNLAASPYAVNNELNLLEIYLTELIVADADSSGLIYVAIVNDNGSLLLDVGHHPTSPSQPLPTPDLPQHYNTALERGIVHVRQPLLLANNAVGYLQYGLSTELLKNATRQSLQQGTALVLLSLLLGTVLVLSLGIPLTRRIGLLIDASEAIAAGNYLHTAPEQGRDEIAKLAHHFNIMANAIRQRIDALEESRAEISHLNASLEQRVAERTSQLATLNRTLEETVTHLQQTQESLIQSEKLASLGTLVAGVAHELNTPIGNALMVATTLEDKTHEFVPLLAKGLKRSELEQYLNNVQASGLLITRSIARAADLIASFKQVAIDQTSSQRRRFELQQVSKEVADTLAYRLKNTAYQLLIDIPDGIAMDSYPGPFGQVLSNLINNALIHGFGGRLQGTIRITAREHQNQRVLLEFSDDGTGISPENLKHIFDPFFTTRLGQGGSGLGLNIVHNIVEGLLGGHLQIESAVGKGTRFLIDLPLQAPSNAHNPHQLKQQI